MKTENKTKEKKEIHVRLPLFGQQVVTLYKISKHVYEKLKDDEIKRLNEKVMHLGILNEIGDVPKFSRWNHITNMIILTEKLSEVLKDDKRNQINPSLDISFTANVKLINYNEKDVSVEDLLKSWAMLYSIGHFVGTFTTEHALLKYIVKNGKEEFLKELENNINDSELKDKIINKFKYIVENERLFEFFKIFTTMKVLKYFNENADKDKVIKDIILLDLLREEYLDNIRNYEQKKKLETILELFKLIRKVSYLTLDGYFSQNFINMNPHWLILNIDTVFKNNVYEELINDINKFYTKTIYQSPENMYYHHKIAKEIENEVFSEYKKDWKKLINDIINNKLDDNILNIVKKTLESIEEEKHIKHFVRITLNKINKSIITLENELFNEINGGIIENTSANHYEIDIYFEPKNTDDIFKICKLLYNLLKEINADIKDIISFEYAGKELVSSTLNISRDNPYKYKFNRRKIDVLTLVFLKEHKNIIIEYIEKYKKDKISNNDTKKELEKSIELIEKIVNNSGNNCLYIYVPKIEALANDNKTLAECDFMLVKYDINNKEITLHVAEIKSGSKKVEDDQIKRIVEYFLILPKNKVEEVIKAYNNTEVEVIKIKVCNNANIKIYKTDKLVFFEETLK